MNLRRNGRSIARVLSRWRLAAKRNARNFPPAHYWPAERNGHAGVTLSYPKARYFRPLDLRVRKLP